MRAKNEVTFGSLFAGVGGLDLGLERAGMRCKWQVEINEYSTKVLEKHWPDVARFRDVRDCGKENLERVDLVCGGFPCQPVSSAGKQAGTDDHRWLWPEFYRIIRELEPRWVLAENVRGLLSNDNGRTFAGVLGDLAQGGYDVWWRVLSAAELGAPHKRDRVFIMAHATNSGLERQVGGASENPNKIGRRDYNTTGSDCNGDSQDVAHATSERAMPVQQPGQRHGTIKGGEEIPHSISQRRQREGKCGLRCPQQDRGRIATTADIQRNWWATEPELGRVAHGIPHRVDRLRCLGNAVVPQVAQWIGERIMELQNAQATRQKV